MSGVGVRDMRDAADTILRTMRAAASGAPSCET
jgi:hypothetical protein